jgi:valyl-tRNA synthetase
MVALVLKESEVSIPMASMVDLEAERKRRQQEIEESQNEVARLAARLKDKAFLSKAPAAVVNKERQKLATSKDKLERLKQGLDKLS